VAVLDWLGPSGSGKTTCVAPAVARTPCLRRYPIIPSEARAARRLLAIPSVVLAVLSMYTGPLFGTATAPVGS